MNKQVIKPWKTDDGEQIQKQLRLLYSQLYDADQAIEAQHRIILREGHNLAFDLALNSISDERALIEREIGALLQQRRSEVLNFALDGPAFDAHRAPIEVVGKILIELQKFYTRIADSSLSRVAKKMIDSKIKDMTMLEMANVYPSSFGMQLTVPTQTDLTGFSPPIQAFEQLFWLLNEQDPSEKTIEMGPWVLHQYKRLLKTLLACNAVPKVSWMHPNGEEIKWTPSRQTIISLESRLSRMHQNEEVTESLIGKMMGASLLSRRFELLTDNGIIRGKISNGIADQVGAKLGHYCVATLRKLVIIDEATEQENKIYTLIDIQEPKS